MTGEATELSEATIRSAWEASDFETAATMALRLYHAEILSFLVWRLRSPSDGQEAFSMLVEGLWSGMPRFGWRCTLRSWMYVLARNAAIRLQRAPHKRYELQLSDSVVERLSDVFDEVRTQTQLFRETYAKNRVRQLRDSLSPEDQLLLVLRVDRGLSWTDLALAMNGDTELEGERLKRESARLRQCFRRVKQELRRLAAQEGLSAQE